MPRETPPAGRPGAPLPEHLLVVLGTVVAVAAAGAWTWIDWVRYARWTGYGLRVGLVALGATLAFYGVLRFARRFTRPDPGTPDPGP